MIISSSGVARCRFTLVFLALLAVCTTTPKALHAQAANVLRATSSTVIISGKTILVLPWAFKNGTRGAHKSVVDVCTLLLEKIGMTVLSSSDKQNTGLTDGPGDVLAELPGIDRMVESGSNVGASYVLAGRIRWRTRGLWIGLGPKTKSTCAVDICIVDVKTRTLMFITQNVIMDSTASAGMLKQAAGSLPFVGMPITMLSAGAKTPEENKAASLAISRAMMPWLLDQRDSCAPIEMSTPDEPGSNSSLQQLQSDQKSNTNTDQHLVKTMLGYITTVNTDNNMLTLQIGKTHSVQVSIASDIQVYQLLPILRKQLTPGQTAEVIARRGEILLVISLENGAPDPLPEFHFNAMMKMLAGGKLPMKTLGTLTSVLPDLLINAKGRRAQIIPLNLETQFKSARRIPVTRLTVGSLVKVQGSFETGMLSANKIVILPADLLQIFTKKKDK